MKYRTYSFCYRLSPIVISTELLRRSFAEPQLRPRYLGTTIGTMLCGSGVTIDREMRSITSFWKTIEAVTERDAIATEIAEHYGWKNTPTRPTQATQLEMDQLEIIFPLCNQVRHRTVLRNFPRIGVGYGGTVMGD